MRNLGAGVLVFTGGFIIMVIEIAGARFLALYFGNSYEVWVSQIGLVMVALALGYYVGGALADHWRRLYKLSWLLFPTGIFTLLIPNFSHVPLDWLVMRHPLEAPIPPLWQKLDPVLGSALIFLLPCVVMAMMSPYMISLTAHQLDRVGQSSGLMFAASTVGSIGGVFITGFVLLSAMGLDNIFRVSGGATIALGILCIFLDPWLSPSSKAGPPAPVGAPPA